MTPVDFIDALLRHYAKRHRSDDDAAQWTREMVQLVGGTDSQVLARAYVLIRDEHEERAFPLPAHIRKSLDAAAEQVYPERITDQQQKNYPWSNRSLRAPLTPEQIEAYRRAHEWQKAVIAKYGSWSNYEAAKRGFDAGAIDLAPRDVSRSAFKALQRNSPNHHLHVDMGALARRITGERE